MRSVPSMGGYSNSRSVGLWCLCQMSRLPAGKFTARLGDSKDVRRKKFPDALRRIASATAFPIASERGGHDGAIHARHRGEVNEKKFRKPRQGDAIRPLSLLKKPVAEAQEGHEG